MADLISIASGNWTSAATWALVDTTSYFNSGTETAGTVTTTYVTSSTFTPGAITVDAIAVKQAARIGTTGTVSVALDQAGATVAGTEVSANMADMPSSTATDGGWVVFKFAAPVTLAAATLYSVKIKTSSSGQLSVLRDSGVAGNWFRMLRTTTTQAPAAGDDVVVVGENTGPGTSNSFTVTINETATTDYGSAPTAANSLIHPGVVVSKLGTLQYGTTAATNYYLKLSNSAMIYSGGTLNIGTTGTPMPRDSTAVLEFDPAADGDYGLIARNGSILNIQGLSRTSGKNVVDALLTADAGATNLLPLAHGNLTGVTAGTQTQNTSFDPTDTGLYAASFVDTTASSTHGINSGTTVGSIPGSTTQVFSTWLARGSGTNNRFVRMTVGDSAAATPSNGFFADIDLQAGTIGSCTAAGNGTASSSAITAAGDGFVCTIIGTCSTATQTPRAGIWACSGSGTTSYVGDTTQNFIHYGAQVFTAASLPSTTLSVDTDTGWLAGDVVAIASTTRTAGECEVVELASNAGASSFTVIMGPVFAHSGTSPTQAEVINITRNVKVRSATSTLMAYVNFKETATVDIDWAEFRYLGEAAVSKRGIEVGTTSGGSCNIQFSSIHDCEDNGLYLLVATSGASITFSSNMMWNLATITGPGCQLANGVLATDIFIDSNILIKTGAGNGWTLADVGGTFTNNTVVGVASIGISLTETSGAIGTLSGNVAHSCGSNGFSFGGTGINGSVGSLSSWRNSGSGLHFASSAADLMIDSAVMFGNTTQSVLIGTGINVHFKSFVSNGDTSFATGSSIAISGAGFAITIILDNCDFSTVSGIKTAHSNDINIGSQLDDVRIVARDTLFGGTAEVASQSNLATTGFIGSQRHDGTAGNHKTWKKNGVLATDATISHAAAPAMRMTPNNASSKLESAYAQFGIQVPVTSGDTVSVQAWTRRSSSGDGAAYNGNQPRLILKADPAMGIAADTVLATHSAADGSWEQLTGTTTAVTDDGALEFVVDCDGTTGWINVDDWSTT